MILAVDGGNSKTDVALVELDGARARARARPAQLAAPPRARRVPRCAAAARRHGGPRRSPCGLRAGDARRRRLPGGGGARPRCSRHPRAGRPRRGSATTPSPFFAPGPSAAGGLRSPAAPVSTASAWRLTGGTCASRRSGRRPATGAAGTTWVRPGSRPPREARTAEDPPPSSSNSCRLTSDWTRRWSSRARSTWARSREPGSSSSRPSSSGLLPATWSRQGSATGSSTRSWPWRAPRLSRLGLEGEDVEIVVGGGLMRGAEPNLLARLETGLPSSRPGSEPAPDEPASDRRRCAARPGRGRGLAAKPRRACEPSSPRRSRDARGWCTDGCRALRAGDEDLRRNRRTGGRRA